MSTIIIKTKNVKAAEPNKPAKPDAGPPLNPIANAMRATGGKTSAVLLLQRIAHWMEYAKVEKLGEKWVVNSAEDWAAEAGLTPDQYKAAKKVLEETGLIISKQMPFGKRNLTHIRLTQRAVAILAEKRAPRLAKNTTHPAAVKTHTPIMPTAKAAPIQPKKTWAELDAETDETHESGNHALH